VLGELAAASGPSRWIGCLLVGAAVLGWIRAQGTHEELRVRESHSKWASNLRDVLNLCCAALLAGGLVCTGVPAPAAILFSGGNGIALDVIRHATKDSIGRQVVSLAVGIGVGLGVAFFPGPNLRAANALVWWLTG
jgi:hypothetical protein